MKSIVACILVFSVLISCKKDDESNIPLSLKSHIEYYGFVVVDTSWDDPTDAEVKTNYADEIHSFSNIADILVVNPDDNLITRLNTFTSFKLKAILHLNELFFELVDNDSPSGSNYNLRADYQNRWNTFKTINQSVIDTNSIGAFYIGEEPTWNGISFTELNTVSQLLETDFPDIPKMLVEAYPSLNNLQVPETLDWIGFDRYFIKNPNVDEEFQDSWQVLKSKLSSVHQRIVVVMDSHYIDWAHGDIGGISINQMGDVANSYYQLAKSDNRVIALLGYFWPNAFDIPESIGARGMPQHVKSEYMQIGKAITGKK